MLKIIIISMVVLLSGCGEVEKNTIGDFDCTIDQHSRVATEALFCIEETSYLSSYCYESAIKRVCTIKKQDTNQSKINLLINE